jgi:hypothetical protein
MLRSVPSLTVLDCLLNSLNQALSFMNSKIASRRVLRLLQCSVAAGLILLLLAIAPFAVAQDVHHELAAADHDGHEHSDTDLCQWLQHHTAGSLDVGAPLPNQFFFLSIFRSSVLPAHPPAPNHLNCLPCALLSRWTLSPESSRTHHSCCVELQRYRWCALFLLAYGLVSSAFLLW